MIDKEKVKYIISENNKIANDSKLEDFESIKAGVLTKIGWPDKQQSLCDYITNLDNEEIIDLITLMDFGRDVSNQTQFIIPFQKRRKSVYENYQNAEKKYSAIYLMKKGKNLSVYLSSALSKLYND